MESRQYLPASGPQREYLRSKGQFWTPPWIAEAMVTYALGQNADHLFDPAVGAGAFFLAAKRLNPQNSSKINFFGCELAPDVLEIAKQNGLSNEDLKNVYLGDFLQCFSDDLKFKAIVANPPYIRHHRLSPEQKVWMKAFSTKLIGKPLDGRAGLHIYFLMRALTLLSQGGRLTFVLPADTVEGVFATNLWDWISRKFRIDAVLRFSPVATPFPNVDINALVLFLSRNTPADVIPWAECRRAETPALIYWIRSGFRNSDSGDLIVYQRNLEEALVTGLSRFPQVQSDDGVPLIHFATVQRGIASGSNEFFLLTKAKARGLGIPPDFLLRAIARTRDISGDTVTETMMDDLDRKGRPTLLFSPDGRPINEFPPAVQDYLKYGETLGLNERALISQRNPWYRMERRKVPPFLFAYLGRRNARFILNQAHVLPLTGFLCVYPKSSDDDFIKRLWIALQQPETINNLLLVGKSYGDGAIKVEPRALERLTIPLSVFVESGLSNFPYQKRLFDGSAGDRSYQIDTE